MQAKEKNAIAKSSAKEEPIAKALQQSNVTAPQNDIPIDEEVTQEDESAYTTPMGTEAGR